MRKKNERKQKNKNKQISKTNPCKTMDYRSEPTIQIQACEVLRHIATHLQFLKRVKVIKL